MIDILGPDGERLGRHFATAQTGRCGFQVRELADGSLQVVSIHHTDEIRAWGGEVLRPARDWEEVRATYPPGSRVVP